MSMQPRIHLLCGIDDLQENDPRWPEQPETESWDDPLDLSDLKENFQPMLVPCAEARLHDKDLYEVVIHETEFGLPSVIGYSVDEISGIDHDLVYAITAMWQGDSAEPGVIEAPKYTLDETISGPGLLRAIQRARDEHRSLFSIRQDIRSDFNLRHHMARFRFDWLYRSLGEEFELLHVPITTYLFKKIGLRVRPRDLKLMVYWYWA